MQKLIAAAMDRPAGKMFSDQLATKLQTRIHTLDCQRRYCEASHTTKHARAVATNTLLPAGEILDRLLKYETHADRTLIRALDTLARLRGVTVETLGSYHHPDSIYRCDSGRGHDHHGPGRFQGCRVSGRIWMPTTGACFGRLTRRDWLGKLILRIEPIVPTKFETTGCFSRCWKSALDDNGFSPWRRRIVGLARTVVRPARGKCRPASSRRNYGHRRPPSFGFFFENNFHGPSGIERFSQKKHADILVDTSMR